MLISRDNYTPHTRFFKTVICLGLLNDCETNIIILYVVAWLTGGHTESRAISVEIGNYKENETRDQT